MTPEEFSFARAPSHCGTTCGRCCEVGGTDRAVLMTRAEAEVIADMSGRVLSAETPKLRISPRAAGCPFYVDKRCTVYSARPVGCRAYVCSGGDDAFEQHPEFAGFYSAIMNGVEDVADVRDWFPEPIETVVNRHTRIALQFSGGKDSIATLLAMQPWWDRLTVYWLNTGDPFPEVVEVVNKARALVPNFVEVAGNRDEVVKQFGYPTDVLSYSSAESAHRLCVGETTPLQDRFTCCYRTLMAPMHERMLADGVTLIVRGQRVEEGFKGIYRSGDMADGFEVLYPIESWSAEQVFSFIESQGWEIPRYYTEGMPHSGDCLVCTAWVGDGRGAYLKKYHPAAFRRYKAQLAVVTQAVQGAVNNMLGEIEACAEDVEED